MISDERLAGMPGRVSLCDESVHPASAWYCEDVPDLLAALRAERERVAVLEGALERIAAMTLHDAPAMILTARVALTPDPEQA